MNIDEIVNNIPNDEPGLKKSWNELVVNWKLSDENVNELWMIMKKWHGNVWFNNASASDNFLMEINKFRSECIIGISGMTVNERLYHFGLFSIYDNMENKTSIYEKINAAQQFDSAEAATND